MITKCFEVRDEGTTIPVLAVKFSPSSDRESMLLKRGGYGGDEEAQSGYTLLVNLNTEESHTDLYKWEEGRTLCEAHRFIMENFDTLTPHDIIDVEYILGETKTIKKSSL